MENKIVNDNIWLFSGQGSSDFEDIKNLYLKNKDFKYFLEKYNNDAGEIVGESLITHLLNDDFAGNTAIEQPLVVMIQLAQIKTWNKYGFYPKVVIGHSIGEFAAAVAANILDEQDALKLAIYRGQVMEDSSAGSMAVVFNTSESDLSLWENISVAAVNDPNSITLSGPSDTLEKFLEENHKNKYIMLKINHPFHSKFMMESAIKFRDKMKTITLNKPNEVHFISTVTGKLEKKLMLSPQYWSDQIVLSVRFFTALQTAKTIFSNPLNIMELCPKAGLLNIAKKLYEDEQINFYSSPIELQKPSYNESQTLFKKRKIKWESNSDNKDENLPVQSIKDIFEIEWENMKISEQNKIVETNTKNLLIARNDLKVDIDNWDVLNSEEISNLDEVFLKQRNTIAIISSGLEDDIYFVLKILQIIIDLNQLSFQNLIVISNSEHVYDFGISALLKTFKNEYDEINTKYVINELDNNNLSKMLNKILLCKEDMLKITKENEIYIPRLKYYSLNNQLNGYRLQSDGTYIITGGQGGLGLQILNSLVKLGANKIILLSRSDIKLKTKEVMEKLSQDVEVRCLKADVTKEADLEEIVEWINTNNWPKVKGIVHAAGILDDGIIKNQTPEKIQNIYNIKVYGSINLRKKFHPTDFFYLFSSATALLGSIGQANYALANSTMDRLAKKWADNGENVLSIQWSSWANNGMAVGTEGFENSLKYGFKGISNEEGINTIEQLVANKKTGIVSVLPIDWKNLKYKAHLFDNLKEYSPETKIVAQDENQLHQNLKKIILDSLGKEFELDKSLLDQGISSLSSVSIRNKIINQFKINLSPSFLFDYPTFESIEKHIKELLVQNKTYQSTNFQDEKQLIVKTPILVIGAGLGGLTFARKLKKKNIPVIVMEKNSKIGGVWNNIANSTSKLQIDSCAYGFDCIEQFSEDDLKWENIYPSTKEIIELSEQVKEELGNEIYFNTTVETVEKIDDDSYKISYSNDNIKKEIIVSGVAVFTGGLHTPQKYEFKNEGNFVGDIKYGIRGDLNHNQYKDKDIVIVGHGAFAIENMRTALEHGANHVTIICRKKNLVLSNVCNWIINSNENAVSMNDVVKIMRPFYEMCGLDIEDLETIKQQDDDFVLNQKSVPAGSDIYFLAQALGKLTVKIGEIAQINENSIITLDNEELKADIIIKCLGFKTDTTIISKMFGEDATINGLWINNDKNLMIYNDGINFSQALTNVKSLLCGSYLFFVQIFSQAYIYYKNHSEEFENLIKKINDNKSSSSLDILFTELWSLIAKAKTNLSNRIHETCPFDKLMIYIEKEWKNYYQQLSTENLEKYALWKLLSPSMKVLEKRENHFLDQKHSYYNNIGMVSTFQPIKKKVLFLSGQGTNSRLSKILLEKTGWLAKSNFDFVIPDPPFEINAFTNEEQLKKLGLDILIDEGLYDTSSKYREWSSGFDRLFNQYQSGKKVENTKEEAYTWELILDYIKNIIKNHGPFDGIMGFCEGSAVASALLTLEKQNYNFGLEKIKFFIAIAPWQPPFYESQGLFNLDKRIDIPTLQILGTNDMDVFLNSSTKFSQNHSNIEYYYHGGQHVYPMLTNNLSIKLDNLMNKIN